MSRERGITKAAHYNWKSRYGGLEATELKRLRDLAAGNPKLNRMYADLADGVSYQGCQYSGGMASVC